MKPIIQGPLDALSKRLDDLEARLRRADVQLGHRSIFSTKGSGEVPVSPGGTTKFLREDGEWVFVTAGGGATGSLNYQRFTYNATGSEGTSFLVNLSTVAGGPYTVVATLADSTGSFSFRVPSGSRTTSQFRMETAAALQANDKIDFLIFEDSAVAGGGGGGHTNVILPHTEVGHNTSYEGVIPLSVMAFTFDPTLNTGAADITSSFLFRSTAAAGTGSATVYTRLYNLTDDVLVCTASFVGTSPATKDVRLYVGSTSTQHMPSGARLYEVQVIASASPSASIEFYSGGIRCQTELT